MKRLMGCKGSHERIENDGFKICHSGQLVNHETRREIVKNDITPPQNIREKGLNFEMQDEEYLSSSEKNLDEHFEKEIKSLLKPLCRTFMKNSGNKRMIKQKEREVENTSETLQRLDEALRRDKVETWNSGRKGEQLKSRI